jgi:2-polyprenyl-3-methyl-5-hydroxy-6-metoxy-1,4-benzoquinol methylase
MVLRKYGKDVDMRFLNRDICKIKQMIKNCAEFSYQNLVWFDDKHEYNCRICRNNKFVRFTNVRGYEYVQCTDCESIVLLNIPDAKKLYEKKGTPASAIYLDEEIFQRRVETIALPKIKFIFEATAGKNNRVWCDVGCGTGELLAGLKQNYNGRTEGIGIEIDPAEICFGRDKGLKIVQEFIDPDNTAEEIIDIVHNSDIVSMLNVLEHMERPAETISFYKLHMKSGSNLVIEVPRHPSIASFANLVCPELTYRHITPPIHFQIFSDKSIKEMAGEEFMLVGTWGFGQGFTDIITSMMLLGNISETGLYESIMDISNDVQKIIDEKGFSDQMIYIFEKK